MMNDNIPLVSIITPCFNGEHFVSRFLDSILYQTYNNIELIFINDGSTDGTEEVVLSYQEKFKVKGIEFVYIFQENSGQASALNQGLKIFNGKYLTWPDSDDILVSDAIKKRVDFLEVNNQFGFCMCKTKVVLETDIDKEVGSFQRVPDTNDDFFSDLIIEKNVVFCPGAYMVRSAAFHATNKNRSIYQSRAGQNWQMLLPLAYYFKCGYMNETLFVYVIRTESHSRQGRNITALIDKTHLHEDLLNVVVKEMNIPEEDEILKLISTKYSRKRLRILINDNNKNLVRKEYLFLKNQGSDLFIDAVYYYCSLIFITRRILQLFLKIKGRIKPE